MEGGEGVCDLRQKEDDLNRQKGQGNIGRMDSRRRTHGAQAGGGKLGLLGVRAPLGVCVEVQRPGDVGAGPRQVWGSYAAEWALSSASWLGGSFVSFHLSFCV